MKNKKIITITEKDFLLANKKAAREEEIAEHGKIISLSPPKIHKSKKDYKREKRVNIENED